MINTIIITILGHLEYMDCIAMTVKLVFGIAHTLLPILLGTAVHGQDEQQ